MAKFTLTDKHGKKQLYNWIKIPPLKEGGIKYEPVPVKEVEEYLDQEVDFLGDSIAVVQLAGLILVKEKAKTSKPYLRKNALTPEEGEE